VNRRTKGKGRGHKRPSRSGRKSAPPRTAKEYFSKPERFQDRWNRVVHAVSRMRAGASLRQASREYGLDPRTVLRLAGPALRKTRSGRWVARVTDRLLRILVIPTTDGLREIALRDSRQASLLAGYWDAVQRYLQIGDASAIQEFDGVYITDADGAQFQLLTNLDELNRLGSAGVLSFESLYARSA